MRTRLRGKHTEMRLLLVLFIAVTLSACKPAAYNNIIGWVYLDVNVNNVRDDGDIPVSGVKVNLIGSEGDTALSSTETTEDGEYSFDLSGTNVGSNGKVQFISPDDHIFSKADVGADDIDSDIDVTGMASFDQGRKENKDLLIDALLQQVPVSLVTELTPIPARTPSLPTETPTATPIPRSGFSDPKGDPVSVITGSPIPEGYPALDIQEVDWNIKDGQIVVDVAVDLPVKDKPEVFEWGLQVGVTNYNELIVADFAILPEGSIDQQYSIISETLTSVADALTVRTLFNLDGVDAVQFTFDTWITSADGAAVFVRGFSRVSGMVSVTDTGLWPEHPAADDPDVIPLVPVNIGDTGSSPRLTNDEWDEMISEIDKSYRTSLGPMNHTPGWQADRNTSFEDPADDVYNASSFILLGKPDPAVDIRFVDVNPGLTDTLSVDIFLATSPYSATLDFSFYSEVAVRDYEGNEFVVAYEIHDGKTKQGQLNLSTFEIEPGTQGYVQILPDRINMLIPEKPEGGEIFVSNFHMATENSIRTYDESVNNTFLFTTQYDLNAALAKIYDVESETGSTLTPVPPSTEKPTPTAMPEPTFTPTALPPTATPTVVATAADDNAFSSTITSTFVVTGTGDMDPVDVAYIFLDAYSTAHDQNNDVWLLGSLHADSIKRYGLAQCQAYLERVTGCCEDFAAVASEYPVEFVFDKDDIVTIYPDAVRLQVEFTVKGETQPRESPMHILVGQYDTFWYANWFTDCGDPEQ